MLANIHSTPKGREDRWSHIILFAMSIHFDSFGWVGGSLLQLLNPADNDTNKDLWGINITHLKRCKNRSRPHQVSRVYWLWNVVLHQFSRAAYWLCYVVLVDAVWSQCLENTLQKRRASCDVSAENNLLGDLSNGSTRDPRCLPMPWSKLQSCGIHTATTVLWVQFATEEPKQVSVRRSQGEVANGTLGSQGRNPWFKLTIQTHTITFVQMFTERDTFRAFRTKGMCFSLTGTSTMLD